jgi:hypothetical protein
MGFSQCHTTEGWRGISPRSHLPTKALDQDDDIVIVYWTLRYVLRGFHYQFCPV